MKAADLQFEEVVSFASQGGVIRFGGSRVILLEATAVGLFRKELIDGLGWNGARMVLMRFGFAQGWRTAENLRQDFPWDSEGEWAHAGSALLTLMGHALAERVVGDGTAGHPL